MPFSRLDLRLHCSNKAYDILRIPPPSFGHEYWRTTQASIVPANKRRGATAIEAFTSEAFYSVFLASTDFCVWFVRGCGLGFALGGVLICLLLYRLEIPYDSINELLLLNVRHGSIEAIALLRQAKTLE